MTDNRVLIELELDEDLQFQLMKMAHDRDITLNQMVNQILSEFIAAHPAEPTVEKKTSWIVQLEQNPDNADEVILPLPPELLKIQGWQEGDTLDWQDNKDGSWILSKP
jgi:hypothetical protein